MGLTRVEPVNHESTSAIIADRLRLAIMDGDLAPGDQLGEADLAGRFEVSRGTLREAMQRLVEEGLLRSERYRGLFVCELSPDDVQDVYVTRNAIEQAAARLILRRGDRAAVADQLDAICEQLRAAIEADDQPAVGRADAAFHEALVTASGSSRLSRMARTLLIETRMCIRELSRTYASPADRVTEHTAIAAALRDGTEALVLGLIDAHMADAVQRLAPDRDLHSPFTDLVD
ncbi:GntR family transcriptional regulator [Actinocatenispora sera]|uniref:GntR family transcriptional regulator n=1 Tax=Actinocatenispora sera TaxID=390989 RepID=A0A810L658_9ACTN|nr:GntR family transcriptional regulator [Actinocatenispora sera]BCJ30717.1 GntR family transcriptional regulator [Actinocatenispora sera]